MSNEESCPTKQDLERLMLGQLPESDTARLAGHLEECDECIEAVRTLTPHDTLVAAMQHSPAAAADLPTGEQVQMLIEHVRGLVGQPATADTNVTSSAGTPSPPSSPLHEQPTLTGSDSAAAPQSDVYDFLAPPQSADELGRMGTYRVLKVLGAGGMGIVFLAEDIHLERQVALKAMKPALAASESAKKRFLREARAAAAIEHDHIIGIHHVGEDRGLPYLAMPLLRGESLEERLPREGKLSLDETLRIGREIAEGLAAAHDRGLIHRDIKPGNVWLEEKKSGFRGQGLEKALLTPNPQSLTATRVKILDFGLARAADDAAHLTQSGAIAGTPAYMAPEQAQGETVDQRCDLFGLGCVLYRCLTGVAPFQGKNAIAVLLAVTQSQPKPMRELDATLPVEVENLISRLLEKKPANRFQTANDVVAEISRIERQQSVMKEQAALVTMPLASAPEPTQLSTTAAHPSAVPTHQPTASLASARTSRRTMRDSPLVAEGPPIASARTAPSGTRSRWRTIAIAAGAVFALILAGVVYRIQTNNGTLVVEIYDEAVEAKLKTDGLQVQDKSSGRTYKLETKLGETSNPERSGRYAVVSSEGFRLHVTDDNGAELNASEFKLTRGDTIRVRVSLEPLVPASKTKPSTTDTADPDRRAAEWVLSIGGKVALDSDPQHYLKKGAPLPAGPWKLVVINLIDNLQVIDDDFDRFAELTELKTIYADDTLITDAALAKIKHLTKLYTLWVGHTVGHRPRGPVFTDAGLVHVKNMKELVNLSLSGARQVTDAGLANLHDHTKLRDVNLAYTGITDAGLIHLKQSSGIVSLALLGTSISDKGLEHLAGMKDLWSLSLGQTRVTDAGLKHLKCADLKVLDLGLTGVTDAGLDDLKRFTKLTSLRVSQTKVTAEGVQKFHEALPQCRIHSDYGNFEPTADPDRRAAEAMLKFGNMTVRVGGQLRRIDQVDALPAESFHIEEVFVGMNDRFTDDDLEVLRGLPPLRSLKLDAERVTDVGVAHLRGFPELEVLSLPNSQLTDAGLDAIQGMTKLRELSLSHTQVSDAGLARLRGLSQLTLLDVGFTRITDAGTIHLRELTRLQDLRLNDNKLSDAGPANIKALSRLQSLALWNTQVTSAGLEHVADLTELESLMLTGTEVTDEGLEHLKKLVRLRVLWLDRTAVKDAGLAALRPLTNLTELNLAHTGGVTDSGLEQLKGLTALRSLSLNDAQVTDAGLEHLTPLTRLENLRLEGTKVTAAGVQRLRAVLPKCKITRESGGP